LRRQKPGIIRCACRELNRRLGRFSFIRFQPKFVRSGAQDDWRYWRQ
jgi:hypothetical protein